MFELIIGVDGLAFTVTVIRLLEDEHKGDKVLVVTK